nr:hypothetical protein [uncultured Ruminococcus sp.]
MADERSSRKSYNREFEAVHLCTTLNDHVVLGVKKTVRWTVFREGVDASILSYLCLISEVGSSERRKYVTHNHNKKYIGTSLFLYTTSNRVTGLESVTRTTAAGGRRKEFEEELQQGV